MRFNFTTTAFSGPVPQSVEVRVIAGCSATAAAQPTDPGILGVLAAEQRLNYLGFRDENGLLLAVDGIMSSHTENAIGLFNAAVNDNGSAFTPSKAFTFIAATDIDSSSDGLGSPPRWLQAVPGANAGWTDATGGNNWGTSWAVHTLTTAGKIAAAAKQTLEILNISAPIRINDRRFRAPGRAGD